MILLEPHPHVIDFHIHVGAIRDWVGGASDLAATFVGNGGNRQWDSDGEVDVDGLLQLLSDEGIGHACLIPTGGPPEATVAIAAASDGRLHPFVTLDPRGDPGAADRLDELCRAGAAGLKIHPVHQHIFANDPVLYPLYEVARAHAIPVMFHIGSSIFAGAQHRFADPLAVDQVAEDFPELAVVCAHAGRGFWEAQTFFLCRLRHNVYLELSGMPPARIVAAFPELDRIRERVLYGSDWPTSPALSTNAKRFQALPFEAATIRAAMYENGARLLRINTG
ncbi:MAG: amidohydrolase family protein [Acidimicrobiales bacterium]|nr:amidohydrolase family protein [Acidimicrobiales bacterium]